MYGVGISRYTPGILSETGPSWTINSAIRAAGDANYQPVVPISEPAGLDAFSRLYGFDYTYKDRLNVSLTMYTRKHSYTRENSTAINFVAVPTDVSQIAAFEGLRMVEFEESRKNLDISYLHPVLTPGLSLGGFVGREWYREINDVSFGSYTKNLSSASSEAGLLSWSQGGVVPVIYAMSGWAYGPMLRFRLFRWLGFNYKLSFISRKGTMAYAGFQPIGRERTAGASLDIAVPGGFAELEDKGIRHNIEATIPLWCRYLLTLGILREDINRKYTTFAGYTVNQTGFISMKVPTVLGIGEVSTKHKISNFEIYLKLNVAICF